MLLIAYEKTVRQHHFLMTGRFIDRGCQLNKFSCCLVLTKFIENQCNSEIVKSYTYLQMNTVTMLGGFSVKQMKRLLLVFPKAQHFKFKRNT